MSNQENYNNYCEYVEKNIKEIYNTLSKSNLLLEDYLSIYNNSKLVFENYNQDTQNFALFLRAAHDLQFILKQDLIKLNECDKRHLDELLNFSINNSNALLLNNVETRTRQRIFNSMRCAKVDDMNKALNLQINSNLEKTFFENPFFEKVFSSLETKDKNHLLEYISYILKTMNGDAGKWIKIC